MQRGRHEPSETYESIDPVHLRERSRFIDQEHAAAAIDMAEAQIDHLALSGHKLYAPFGAGALISRTPLHGDPLLHGGGAIKLVTLDDVVLPPASLGARVPVDPGSHRVHAEAPGYASWDGSVDAPPRSATSTLAIPALVHLKTTSTAA